MKKVRHQATGIRLQAVGLFGLLLVACSLWLAACGYTTRSLVAVDFKTINIKPFLNKVDLTQETSNMHRIKTYYPLLERDITNAVINKFISDGNLKVVREENADCVLKGELVDYRRDALRYTEGQDVLEYRINLVVNLALWDNKENKLRWEESNFVGETTYFVSGTLAKTEATAVENAITDLARRIVSRVIEEW